MSADRYAGVSRTALLKRDGYYIETPTKQGENGDLAKTLAEVVVSEKNLKKPDFIVTGMSAEVQNRLEGWNGQELPEDIDELIDNKAYRPRVRLLCREHGLKYVRKLAELARRQDVAKPSHYFAKAYSVKNWHEKTLQVLEDLFHMEGIVLKTVGSISQKTKQWVFYVIGTIRQIGLETFEQIANRAKNAEDPEHYLFGALNLARQAVADGGSA